ncbi:MAG: VPLPA-CTERM sorting domain-containing protein [Boseongicola sp.]|nr:VPLPA-CTERM sorting domain-containing protein [Boseongicola sp.]MDD9977157.1 VPLPA-CTERM sorting domain-containing protein [Boseongicola sp.]
MKLSTTFKAIAVAGLLPFAAQASSVSIIETGVDEGTDGYLTGENVIDVFAGASFNGSFLFDDFVFPEYTVSEAAAVSGSVAPTVENFNANVVDRIQFRLENNSTEDADVVVWKGNANVENYGFYGGVDVWFNGLGSYEPIVGNVPFNESIMIGAGESVLLTFEWNLSSLIPLRVANGGSAYPSFDLNFTVGVSEVPVPAAGFLLLAGLGGFAALRRKQK